MSNRDETKPNSGLPADQEETGPVTRVKDIVLPFSSREASQKKGNVLISFASDEGVRRNFGRIGAADGPKIIREFLFRLPVHQSLYLADAGNVECQNDDLEQAQNSQADMVAHVLNAGLRPLILGGGHEVAFGSFLGFSRHLGHDFSQRAIGVINLDAHFDLRQATIANSGTPFRQIADLCAEKGNAFHYFCYGISKLGNTTALFERADKLGVIYRLDEELRERNLTAILTELDKALATLDDLYLSVDLDVLPASVAPGVSAPAARGVPLEIIEDIIDIIIRSGKLRLADIAEFNPKYDRDDQTARVAARIAYRLITA